MTFIYRDESGSQTWYEPISVIDYHGRLATSGESQGHYTCDVKVFEKNVWYRTNDSAAPVQIHNSDVSKHGYVVLYKRSFN